MRCSGCYWPLKGIPYLTIPQSNQPVRYRRFLNHYLWSTRSVIRATRKSVLQQIAQHRPHPNTPLRVLIDLTTLEKCGKFLHLSTATDDPKTPAAWVRLLNGKRGVVNALKRLM